VSCGFLITGASKGWKERVLSALVTEVEGVRAGRVRCLSEEEGETVSAPQKGMS
jgi:hypothetical protein